MADKDQVLDHGKLAGAKGEQVIKRLSFHAEWYQEEASYVKKFIIVFNFLDKTIEVYDARTMKIFLRRTQFPEMSENDLFIGAKVNIYGRQMDIKGYADDFTRCRVARFRKRTFILVKHSVMSKLGPIICALVEGGFVFLKGMMLRLTIEQISGFLGGKNRGDVGASILVNQLMEGAVIVCELMSDNAVEKMVAALNGEQEYGGVPMPSSLAIIMQRPEIRNGIYCSPNDEDMLRESNYFFNSKGLLAPLCIFENSTLGVVKPHAIKEGKLGLIITEILNHGFKIVGLRMHCLERVNSEEFLEVYRGILPDYCNMVVEMSSGASMALAITCHDASKDAHKEFRDFCGPMDPEVAQLLRPDTLRAKFGVSKALNAVHCTDLPEDTHIELQYMFKILD